MKRLLVVILCLLSFPVMALELEGDFSQGGLVVGRTAPGARVSLDGRNVRVSEEGVFLVGFGRDAGGTAELAVREPGGGRRLRTLEIEPRKWKVQRIDGLPGRKVTPKPEDLAHIRADNAAIGRVRKLDTATPHFMSGFVQPVEGRISGVFGSQRILNGKPRRPHNGLDIAAPEGTPVRAMADGLVALVHPDMFFTGKTVMIDHGHGLSSVYVHMSAITVEEGQWIAKGAVIGKVGRTGRATGPHLHWGVSLFSTHLDPSLLIDGEKR